MAEGFEVNVAVLPQGEDPDTFIRKQGPDGYLELLGESRPYLEYLLDRAAAHDLTSDEGAEGSCPRCWPVAARIPTRRPRDQFADRIGPQSAYYRRGCPGGNPQGGGAQDAGRADRGRPSEATARETAEKGLIWALDSTAGGAGALNVLQDNDLEGLATRKSCGTARIMDRNLLRCAFCYGASNSMEAQLVTRCCGRAIPPARAQNASEP